MTNLRAMLCLSLFFFLFLTASGALAMAGGCGDQPCANCHSLTLSEANTLLHEVGEVKKIERAPVEGLWLLELERDGQKATAFLDYAKKNIIAGTIFPLGEGKSAEAKPAAAAPADPSAIPVADSVVMGNPRGAKKLFVFTDPDCPYCAKLHDELKKLVAKEPDLAVYVKMFPLRMHPQAFAKARVILGQQSLDLLDKAFRGEALPPLTEKDRKEPVAESIRLGQSLGIRATPTLVFADGTTMTGAQDSAALQRLLEQHKRR